MPCAFGGSSQAKPQTQHRGLRLYGHYLNASPGVNYVGSKACARCHANLYTEYSQTLMGRSMVLPGNPWLPALPAPVKIHDYKSDRDFEIYRQGRNLYQSESELAPDGSQLFRDTRRIAYAIGAGQNGIGYLVEEGNYLFEAPLSYYTKPHTWQLSPGYEFGDYGFDRRARTACLACHSGRPQPVLERPGLYRNPPFEQLAIGCENCHGPGQLHVEERTKGEPLEGTIDRSVVNPADLPGWLADNICMMCHEGGDMRVLQPGKTLLDFRPGAPLDRTVAIFAVPFTPQSPPQSPLLQQYTQMVLSKCYLGSGGKMTCLTCHDPHFEPTAAGSPAYFRRKCLACHTVQSCSLALAVRLRQSPPDDCVGCHMPPQNLQTISHAALTNHRIIAYSGEPFPDAAFHMTTPRLRDLVHLDRIPGKEAAALPPIVLLKAYGELLKTYPEYKASYNKLLDELARAQPHNPLILSDLGRRAERAGTAKGFAEAQDDLRQAIAAGSTEASDLDLYGRLLIHSGSMAEAVPVLKRDIALNPYSAEPYKMLAVAYIKLNEYGLALETMKAELQAYPQDSAMRAFIAKVQGSFAAPPK
ncbi:MAG: tetratricopeptide repeat protein [Terriglobia bacterium]